jgi:hypothetical protein
MSRSLYRFYLYFVSFLLVQIAIVGLAACVIALLELTELRNTFSPYYYGTVSAPSAAIPPAQGLSAQQMTFGVTLLFIAGGLLGLHYRLLRREMATDVTSGASAIRAFFLHLTQASAGLIAVFAGAAAMTGLAASMHGDDAPAAGTALAALAVLALVELERRRAQPGPGAAIVFQRLNHYGVPLIVLLFSLSSLATSALYDSAVALAIQWNGYNPCPGGSCSPTSARVLLTEWVAVTFVAGILALYAMLARRDTRSAIRQATRFLSLAYVSVFALVGLFLLAELGVRHVLGVSPQYGPQDLRLQFVAPLVFGLVMVAVFTLLLRGDAAESPLGRENTVSTLLAVLGIIAAGFFWWGVGAVLHTLLDSFAQIPFSTADWAVALATVVAGIPYIPLALLLARRSHLAETPGPRRGFALGMLAIGSIAGVIGAAMLLYAVVTNLLGAPLDNWGEVARTGGAVLAVGAVLAAIYGTITAREGYLRAAVSPSEAPSPAETTVAPATIEQVLDDLLARRLTRDEAAARLRALSGPPST